MESHETGRLILRPWRESDLEPFSVLNADPVAMEFMRGQLDRAQSDALVRKISVGMALNGFGLWAVEVKDGAPFVGFTGLSIPSFSTRFTPCVEVGWRLLRDHWGHGFATEAARKSVELGFERFGLKEIVSFTTVANTRSRAVMERIGMSRDPADDFDHPALEEGHPIRPHVLYRLPRSRSRQSPV